VIVDPEHFVVVVLAVTAIALLMRNRKQQRRFNRITELCEEVAGCEIRKQPASSSASPKGADGPHVPPDRERFRRSEKKRLVARRWR